MGTLVISKHNEPSTWSSWYQWRCHFGSGIWKDLTWSLAMGKKEKKKKRGDQYLTCSWWWLSVKSVNMWLTLSSFKMLWSHCSMEGYHGMGLRKLKWYLLTKGASDYACWWLASSTPWLAATWAESRGIGWPRAWSTWLNQLEECFYPKAWFLTFDTTIGQTWTSHLSSRRFFYSGCHWFNLLDSL